MRYMEIWVQRILESISQAYARHESTSRCCRIQHSPNQIGRTTFLPHKGSSMVLFHWNTPYGMVIEPNPGILQGENQAQNRQETCPKSYSSWAMLSISFLIMWHSGQRSPARAPAKDHKDHKMAQNLTPRRRTNFTWEEGRQTDDMLIQTNQPPDTTCDNTFLAPGDNGKHSHKYQNQTSSPQISGSPPGLTLLPRSHLEYDSGGGGEVRCFGHLVGLECY